MRPTKFTLNQSKKSLSDNRSFSVISKALLYSGIAVLMSALIYMIINITKADSFVNTWIAFMAVGVYAVFMSVLISRINRKRNTIRC